MQLPASSDSLASCRRSCSETNNRIVASSHCVQQIQIHKFHTGHNIQKLIPANQTSTSPNKSKQAQTVKHSGVQKISTSQKLNSQASKASLVTCGNSSLVIASTFTDVCHILSQVSGLVGLNMSFARLVL